MAVPLGITILFSLEMKLFLDDSMIYLTYAKNFSSGLGWTFNPGANDHAATSILHTLSQSLIFLAFFDPQNPDSIFLFLKLFEAAIGRPLLLCVDPLRDRTNFCRLRRRVVHICQIRRCLPLV